jgi:hypothetical protein
MERAQVGGQHCSRPAERKGGQLPNQHVVMKPRWTAQGGAEEAWTGFGAPWPKRPRLLRLARIDNDGVGQRKAADGGFSGGDNTCLCPRAQTRSRLWGSEVYELDVAMMGEGRTLRASPTPIVYHDVDANEGCLIGLGVLRENAACFGRVLSRSMDVSLLRQPND